MKRWENLGAPDDPEVWRDVLNFWPTPRGTYEVADGWDGGTTKTATGETTSTQVIFAFVGATPTTPRAYIFTSAKNWEYSAGTLTDRTNSKGAVLHACQFGTSTIGARGVSATTVVSTGGNFSDLGGSPPNAALCAVAGNVVGLFNTSANADGWATSDLNDATVWTPASSNKAANGRLLGQSQGPITAVATLGKDFIVFKRTGIYRGTYVGGQEKWIFDLISAQFGCLSPYAAVDCGGKVVFVSPHSAAFSATDFTPIFYVYDGSRIDRLNPMTELACGGTTSGAASYCLTYEPRNDTLIAAPRNVAPSVSDDTGSNIMVYSFQTGQWGRLQKTGKSMMFLGEAAARNTFFGDSAYLPALAGVSAADAIKIYLAEEVDSGTHSTDPYVLSHRYGQADAKTKASCVTPLLRRRTDLGSGSLSLAVNAYRERHSTSAASTDNVTESTQRNRFDFTRSDNFAEFKLTATDVDIEIDDLLVDGKPAGRN